MKRIIISSVILSMGIIILSCGKAVKQGVGPDFVGAGSIYGYVYLKDQGDHSGTTIALSDSSLKVVTNSQGYYKIDNMSVGTYIVTVTKEHFGSANVENVIISGAGQSYHVPNITLGLTDAVVYVTTINYDNGPIDGVKVQLSNGTEAYTDSSGRVTFSGLTTGTYSMIASKDGCINGSLSVNVTGPGTFNANINLYRIALQQLYDESSSATVVPSYYAQSFIANTSRIRGIYVIELFGPQNKLLSIGIYTDNGGNPGTAIIEQIPEFIQFIWANKPYHGAGKVTFPTAIDVTVSNTYWIVIHSSVTLVNDGYSGRSNKYPDGIVKRSSDKNTWQPFFDSDFDLPFIILY